MSNNSKNNYNSDIKNNQQNLTNQFLHISSKKVDLTKSDRGTDRNNNKIDSQKNINTSTTKITLNGKQINKLANSNKPEDVVNSYYKYETEFYDADDNTFDDKYKTKIKDNKNVPYIIAKVELKDYKKEKTNCYIISCFNYGTKKSKENKEIGLFEECEKIIKIKIIESNNVTNMSYVFSGCDKLKEINLNNINTNNVTDMSYMFYGCSALEKLDLNNINTNNVTDMSYMFYGCSALEELDLNNINTNNVTDMNQMFRNCNKLELGEKIKNDKELSKQYKKDLQQN